MIGEYKRWVDQWKTASEALDKQRAAELSSLTDERALQASEWLLSEYGRLAGSAPKHSGLVELQEYLTRWRH